MPDRRKSGLTKPALVALVVVVAGALAMTVALLSGSSSPTNGNPAKSSEKRVIEPVDPINPNDTDAGNPNKKIDPLDNKDDPFAASFGEKTRHKVVVRVTADGPAGISVRYNDGKSARKNFIGSYSSTRTFKSRFPTVGVVMQIFPPSTTGSCSVTVDGERLSSKTTNEQWGVVACGG